MVIVIYNACFKSFIPFQKPQEYLRNGQIMKKLFTLF